MNFKIFCLLVSASVLNPMGAFAQTQSLDEGSGHSGGGGDYVNQGTSELCGTPTIKGEITSYTIHNWLSDLSGAGSIHSDRSVIAPLNLPQEGLSGVIPTKGSANYSENDVFINGVSVGGDEAAVFEVARAAIRAGKDLCRVTTQDKNYIGARITYFVKP
jgi:hypothetical protein